MIWKQVSPLKRRTLSIWNKTHVFCQLLPQNLEDIFPQLMSIRRIRSLEAVSFQPWTFFSQILELPMLKTTKNIHQKLYLLFSLLPSSSSMTTTVKFLQKNWLPLHTLFRTIKQIPCKIIDKIIICKKMSKAWFHWSNYYVLDKGRVCLRYGWCMLYLGNCSSFFECCVGIVISSRTVSFLFDFSNK